MGRTFINGDFSVTVNDDRSIRVRTGDWISKYSAAIYGDPLAHWDRYQRKLNGTLVNLSDPNKIVAGEMLYHLAPLPGEMSIQPLPRGGSLPPAEAPQPQLPPDCSDARRVMEFLKYIKSVLNPVTGWTIEGNGGADLNASFFTLQYVQIGARPPQASAPLWYHAIGAGYTFGLEDAELLGATISPTSYPGVGFIGKFAQAGASLSPDEICGTYMVMDIGAGWIVGGSISILCFGMILPVEFIAKNLVRYLRGEETLGLHRLIPAQGFMVLAGSCSPLLPSLGVAARFGVMHRKACVFGK